MAPVSAPVASPVLTLAEAQEQFADAHGYLSACTLGRATRKTRDTIIADAERWHIAGSAPATYEAAVAGSRGHYARIADVAIDRIAIGSQTSVFAGMIAASVPDGAEILCTEGDFSSVVLPFLQHAHRGVTVRHAPLDGLAESIGPRTWLVSFSLVQSANGRIADADAIIEAAERAGAFTLCDTTQAAGWMPVAAARFDATVCHAYKWLCAPRGVAFLTVKHELADRLLPVHAGWYAGDDPWQSCYGPDALLADDARRFDVSPAWQAWLGAEPALSLFADVDMPAVTAHNISLADAFCEGLGIPACGQAIVSWPDPKAEQLDLLTRAGITASGRAGCARVAFHLWNDESDVEAALRALA